MAVQSEKRIVLTETAWADSASSRKLFLPSTLKRPVRDKSFFTCSGRVLFQSSEKVFFIEIADGDGNQSEGRRINIDIYFCPQVVTDDE